MARTSLLSAEQLLERLGKRLDLLKEGHPANPRQQTLRATIDWSYGLLDADEQRVYRAFSVFCRRPAPEAEIREPAARHRRRGRPRHPIPRALIHCSKQTSATCHGGRRPERVASSRGFAGLPLGSRHAVTAIRRVDHRPRSSRRIRTSGRAVVRPSAIALSSRMQPPRRLGLRLPRELEGGHGRAEPCDPAHRLKASTGETPPHLRRDRPYPSNSSSGPKPPNRAVSTRGYALSFLGYAHGLPPWASG